MDVGATSLGKENDQTVECSATSNTANSDTNVLLTSNSLQESVATSRLSSLLSTLVAEPLAAAPRMPQQHSPRNTNVGEKASLPQPVSTPAFHVPPHIMGRNINNPAEDIVAHGRKLQKPRLGVRVPYRNLTSQIVTQDELAQELLERSLKKHPVHDIPEGGDLFFAIKLTQRLANRLSPGNAQVSTTSQSDQNPGKSSQAQSQQSSQANCTAPKHSSVAESPAIPDHRDLIAILEGDGDTDWVPVPTTSVTTVATVTTPPSISHITNVKLDPVLEKELALKQLMEFQNNSRRRKSEKNQKSGEKPQRQRSQNKKEPLNKENGSLDHKTGHITAVDTENNNSRPSNVLHLGRSNNTSQTNMTKVTRKRKLEDSSPIEAKRPRVSGKKATVQSKSESKGNAAVKTEKKIQRKMKDSKGSSPNNITTTLSSTSSPSSKTKMHGVAVGKEVTTKNISPNKPKKSNSPNISVKVQHADANLNNVASPTNDLSISLTSITDDFPEFGRSFTTPIRTYSPKKRTNNTSLSPNKATDSTLKLKSDKSGDSHVKIQESESVKVVTASPPKQSSDDPVIRKKKETKESPVDNKKRRMREVDRLLMDEGAINLLYEAEHGESRRRSNAPEENETALVSQRRILKSVRRKKKDLMLKTRLVKNAVLRLSNSLSVLPPVAARITRRTDLLMMPSTSADQTAEPQRKLSLDSRDSLQSPPPLTPVDPPSPQSFVYSGRLPIPAEASRIIRRHSSSSNFSSRSASPNTNRLGDTSQNNIEASEKTADIMQTPVGNSARATAPSSTGGRKKGVPIFVRKPQVIQTYQGKKKKISALDSKSSGTSAPMKQISNKESHQSNDLKASSKVLSTSQKLITDKKKATAVKKISVSEKLKLKEEMSKNFQKGFQASKVKGNIKKLAENAVTKTKKKDDMSKEKSSKPEVTGGDAKASFADDMLNLTSCLAAAASAFAAEAQEVGDRKVIKKSAGSGGTSHTSSPCPSRSSKSPTPTNKTSSKKDPRVAPPLSPNAATYSNLLKTLENEGQKVRRKDGEEITKQRSSVRQNAGTYHYKDISLRRYDNLVQVILTPQSTKMKNALNLQVLRELKDVLLQLKKDDSCRAVLLTSTGSTFCQGVDFCSLLHVNAERRKAAAQELAQALKDFLKSLALFSKPIVAGVHGAAVGLGVTMLPFFDMVFASDKATFYTPYAKLGQVPEGAAILTLPHMFGNAVTSELLFGCRKLTASEALHFGLVTRILWPDRFQEELIPVIRGMASQSAQSMEATKALLRHNLRTKLDAALESESHLLMQHWISAECQANFKKFLDDEDVGLQKQRMEA